MGHLKLSRIVAIGMLCAIVIACSGDPLVSPTAPEVASFATAGTEGKPVKPPKDSDTFRLCVAFDAGGAIAGDGSGEYCNDNKMVAALAEQFRLDTNKSDSRPGRGRNVAFDFSGCTSTPSDPPCASPFTQGQAEIDMRTLAPPALNAMVVGTTSRVRLSVKLTSLESSWWLHYGPAISPWPSCSRSDGVTVTRESATEWTIEAALEDDACLTESADGNAPFLERGHFSMPFRITMTAQ